MTELDSPKDICERCGFVPIDTCQLDAVQIDGCIMNYDPSNYMTLCANCQTFRTAMNDDDLSPEEREEVREAWTLGELFN